MAKLVWFFGTTAVGKETLMNRIAEDARHPLIKRFGLDQPIIIQQDALRKRHAERRALTQEIRADRNACPHATFLLKMQGYDIGAGIPAELEVVLPDNHFIYAFLDASPDIIRERRIERGQQPLGWDDARDRLGNITLANSLIEQGMQFVPFDNTGNVPVELPRMPLE